MGQPAAVAADEVVTSPPVHFAERDLKFLTRQVRSTAMRTDYTSGAGHKPVRLEAKDGRLTGESYDGDMWVKVSAPCDGELTPVDVHYNTLARVANALPAPGAMSLETERRDTRLRVTAGRFTARMPTYEGLVTPRPKLKDECTIELTADDIRQLRRLMHFASDDDNRPIITGVYFNGEHAVATDSYRLGVYDLPLAFPGEIANLLIPRRFFERLVDPTLDTPTVLTVATCKDTNRSMVTMDVEGIDILCRTLEGSFPNYQGLIPSSYPNRLVTNRAAFYEAVNRVALCDSGSAAPIRLTFTKDTLRLRYVEQDVIALEDEIECSYEGADLTVAFNPRYLLEGIKYGGTDPEIHLELIDNLKPAMLDPGARFRTLLMPVRVS